MEKIKILVVDDTKANIEAAKVASKEFPQHEFAFMTSANEAFEKIENFDAVITDLFFPEKPGNSMSVIYKEMQKEYSEDNFIYDRLIAGARHLFSSKRLQKNIEIVKNGLHQDLESREELNEPEFPLGLAIFISAVKNANRRCLVSGIHCHGVADGDIILLPLMSGIGGWSFDAKQNYGENTLNYFSDNRLYGGKHLPLVWEKAIHCILAQ